MNNSLEKQDWILLRREAKRLAMQTGCGRIYAVGDGAYTVTTKTPAMMSDRFHLVETWRSRNGFMQGEPAEGYAVQDGFQWGLVRVNRDYRGATAESR